jgi:hypothetical protein
MTTSTELVKEFFSKSRTVAKPINPDEIKEVYAFSLQIENPELLSAIIKHLPLNQSVLTSGFGGTILFHSKELAKLKYVRKELDTLQTSLNESALKTDKTFWINDYLSKKNFENGSLSEIFTTHDKSTEFVEKLDSKWKAQSKKTKSCSLANIECADNSVNRVFTPQVGEMFNYLLKATDGHGNDMDFQDTILCGINDCHDTLKSINDSKDTLGSTAVITRVLSERFEALCAYGGSKEIRTNSVLFTFLAEFKYAPLASFHRSLTSQLALHLKKELPNITRNREPVHFEGFKSPFSSHESFSNMLDVDTFEYYINEKNMTIHELIATAIVNHYFGFLECKQTGTVNKVFDEVGADMATNDPETFNGTDAFKKIIEAFQKSSNIHW